MCGFRCNNSYDEVVGSGQDKVEFVEAIQEQLADLLSTTQQNIDHLEVSSGSIVVDFTLAAYDGDDVSQFKKSYDDLAEAFKKGDVELVVCH